MSEKVKLPKEVAEAIEHYRGKGLSDVLIVVIAATDGTMRGHALPLTVYVMDDPLGSDKLMSALVNGYEVEKSPEEELLAFYKELRGSQEGSDSYQAHGIEMALDILGIEIEGVNA